MQETVMVTGAAGFIGSHVAAALARRGDRVIALDNFDPFYPRVVKERNLREAQAASGGAVLVEEADVCDAHAIARIFAHHKPAALVHLAAKAGVRPSIADPAGYMHANVTGTARVLHEATRAGCSRVVIASSSSVYGNPGHAPFHEDLDVSRPISPYAASKRACELAAFTHHHLTKLPVACLRFFTVLGPRQRPDLAIATFMAAIASGEPIRVFGDGTSARDYTFVDDIVAGVLAALDRIPQHGYRVWNLGNNRPVTLAAMIETIERVVGRPAVIRREPMQPGDVEQTCADITRSARELGFAPRTPFEEGVCRQWAWAQSVHD